MIILVVPCVISKLMTYLKFLFLIQSTACSSQSGIPFDLVSYLPATISPDFGLYSSCELPRGSGMFGSGICVSGANLTGLGFCGELVTYTACVPPSNPLWPNWNASAKDSVVEQLFTQAVTDRVTREEDSLSSGEGYVPMLFTGNDACVDEYKRVLCLQNFPECDSSNAGKGFGICSPRCVEFFTICKFDLPLINSLCQAGVSTWPLNQASSSNLHTDSAQLVDQTTTECTGKGSGIVKFSAAFIIIAWCFI